MEIALTGREEPHHAEISCREGQALEFIPRERAGEYPIPPYLLSVWDHALDAAQMTVSR